MINYQKVWATLDIDEKMAFRDRTIKAMQEIYPHYIVRTWEPTEADCFFVGNKQENVRVRVPLKDLYAWYSTSAKTADDLKEAIFNECSGMLKQVEDVSVLLHVPDFTWSDVRDRAIPHLTRLSEVEDVECIKYPLGAEVVTTMVIDAPDEGVLYRISPQMLDGWGKTEQELYNEAMSNLNDLAVTLEIVGTNTPRTELWPNEGKGWAANCILLPQMRKLLADTMGASKFRFGIPSRHRFYAWADIDDEKFQIEQKAKMEREMERWPSALTSDIYEVDENGNITYVKPQPQIPPVPLVSNN